MDLFPIFLKLEGRRSLVVGAGAIGEEKSEGLLRSGAEVRVVAPQATPRVRGWARAGKILWDVRRRVSRFFRQAGADLVPRHANFTEDHEYERRRHRPGRGHRP
jgi:siroheme synthase-like protein